MGHDEKLKLIDGPVGVHIIRHQQLVSTFRALKLFFHGNGDLFIDVDGTDLAALAFDDDGILPQRLFRDGRVNAEALVDAETGITGQIQG